MYKKKKKRKSLRLQIVLTKIEMMFKWCNIRISSSNNKLENLELDNKVLIILLKKEQLFKKNKNMAQEQLKKKKKM